MSIQCGSAATRNAPARSYTDCRVLVEAACLNRMPTRRYILAGCRLRERFPRTSQTETAPALRRRILSQYRNLRLLFDFAKSGMRHVQECRQHCHPQMPCLHADKRPSVLAHHQAHRHAQWRCKVASAVHGPDRTAAPAGARRSRSWTLDLSLEIVCRRTARNARTQHLEQPLEVRLVDKSTFPASDVNAPVPEFASSPGKCWVSDLELTRSGKRCRETR